MFLPSCSDEESEAEPVKVYFSSTAVRTVMLFSKNDTAFSFGSIRYDWDKVNQGEITAMLAGGGNEFLEKYNAARNTQHELLPENNYSLNHTSLVIENGKKISEEGMFTVKNIEQLDTSKTYLLPVTIQSLSATANVIPHDLKKTSWWVLSVNIPEEPVEIAPPTNVFNVAGRNLISLFVYGNFLVTHETNGLINLYAYDASGQIFSTTSSSTNGGWNVFNTLMPSTTGFIGRWADSGNLWEYTVDQSGFLAGDFQTKGTGFNDYLTITSSVFHDALFGIKSTGELYGIKREGTQWTSIAVKMADGWNQYSNVVAYGNGILATDSNGYLWFFTVNQDLSIDSGVLTGTGWEMFQNLFVFGNNLLTIIDDQLWMYSFDLDGYWKAVLP
jgi:hypothetical protein